MRSDKSLNFIISIVTEITNLSFMWWITGFYSKDTSMSFVTISAQMLLKLKNWELQSSSIYSVEKTK